VSISAAVTAQRPVTQRAGILAVLGATVAWSFGGVLAKSVDAPGVVITMWRNWFAAALWFALAAITHQLPTRSEIRQAAPAGVLFGANLALFFSSLKYIPLVNALVVIALTPVIMLIVARKVLGERITAARLGCALLAVSGVVMYTVVTPTSGKSAPHRPVLGYALVVSAMSLWVVYLVVSKRVRSTMATVPFLSSISLVGAIVVTPVALVLGRNAHAPHGVHWLWIALLAIGPGMMAHGLVAWAQKHVDASVSSVLMQAETIGAAVIAWIVLGERLSPAQMVALAVVLAGLTALAVNEDRLDSKRQLADTAIVLG
jgi:drug/metabolite transporter (DMT)-like permease